LPALPVRIEPRAKRTRQRRVWPVAASIFERFVIGTEVPPARTRDAFRCREKPSSGRTRIVLAHWAKGVSLHGFFHPARKGTCYQRQYRRSRGRLVGACAADLRPRVGGGAISASAGMPRSRCSFQAILIVRERFLVRMSDARWREPSRRPRWLVYIDPYHRTAALSRPDWPNAPWLPQRTKHE
jgi:hypothetical protein